VVGAAILLPRTRRGRSTRIRSIIVTTAVRGLAPLLILFSVFLLLRGADASGGGFPAGLVGAAGLVVYSFGYGAVLARRVLPFTPVPFIAAGLLLLAASGMPGLLFGRPFLT